MRITCSVLNATIRDPDFIIRHKEVLKVFK